MHRVLVIDDHDVLRDAVCALLDMQDDIEVVGQAENGAVALERVAALLPDLTVVDVSLPDVDGIELARQLRLGWPDIPVLILSGHGDSDRVGQAFAAGVAGYILKGNSLELVDGVRAVLAGRRYASPGIAST